jgi:uncharacterized damage-inducible protein DinB
MNHLIEECPAGTQTLLDAIAGMTDDQLDAKPVPGRWSTRQVICHIADCEVVYADRMKRVIVEDNPTMMSLDPDAFASGLAYDQRDVDEELQLIEATRRHMGRILRTLQPSQFQRTGNHSTDGSLTLEMLLLRITGHILHHIKFIEEMQTVTAAGDPPASVNVPRDTHDKAGAQYPPPWSE